MNQQQRKFLVQEITKRVEAEMKALEGTKKEYPSANNFFFKAVLDGSLKLQSEEKIIEALKTKALNSKERSNWLSSQHSNWYERDNTVTLKLEELFIFPEDYKKLVEETQSYNRSIVEKISKLKEQKQMIEMRIQLASDSVLKKIINEIDSLGELSFLDEKMKLLTQ